MCIQKNNKEGVQHRVGGFHQDKFEMICPRRGKHSRNPKTNMLMFIRSRAFLKDFSIFIDVHSKRNNHTEGFQNIIGGFHQDIFEMISQRRGTTRNPKHYMVMAISTRACLKEFSVCY